jgi:uncharacterized protein (DUF58 family)
VIYMELEPKVLRQLDTFALRTRRSVLGLRHGTHRSQRRGHGVEFAEYRNYEFGDNPRSIDWSVYARSDKLYIKRYLEEENVSVHLVIDGSSSLVHPMLRAKWLFACRFALCASYVALATQDPVTVSVLGHRHSGTFWGAKAFHPLRRFLNDVSQSLPDTPRSCNLVDEARRAACRVKFPGICIFVSDFLFPLDQTTEMLGAFQARNMEVHALQVLGPSDSNPAAGSTGATLVDSETELSLPTALDSASRAEYLNHFKAHNLAVRNYCLSHNIQFVSTAFEEPTSESVIDTLTRMSLFV